MTQACTPGAWEALAALAAALLLDTLYPRHEGLLLAVHPVRTGFILARRLAPEYSSTLRGLAATLVVLTVHLAPWLALLCTLHGPLWLLAAVAALKFSLSLRLLLDHALRVASLLEDGMLDEARRELSNIVRRPTGSLPGHLVASAALESVAENLVDGYTGPIAYYPLLGPLGSLLFRAVNTLDAALGYKTPEYIKAGRVPAALDTLMAYIPARLTALAIALAAPLAGGSVLGAVRCWARCHGLTESRNAGHPMAALAGALGVRLEKPGVYVINPEGRPPGPRDVRRGVALAVYAALLYTLAAVLAVALAWGMPA